MLAAHPIVFGYRTGPARMLEEGAATSTPALEVADRATPGRAIRDATSTKVHKHGQEMRRAYTSDLFTK